MASDEIRIETNAMKLMAHWKWLFATTVAEHAVKLASKSKNPQFVTVEHYRCALKTALKQVRIAIDNGFPHEL
jgi:hypothetical protein